MAGAAKYAIDAVASAIDLTFLATRAAQSYARIPAVRSAKRAAASLSTKRRCSTFIGDANSTGRGHALPQLELCRPVTRGICACQAVEGFGGSRQLDNTRGSRVACEAVLPASPAETLCDTFRNILTKETGVVKEMGDVNGLVAPAADVDPYTVLEKELGPFSREPTVPPAHPLVIVISGPSGVGKDAVINRLRETRPDLHFVVTATSRPMRKGEVDGKDYFFITKEKFVGLIESGELLEHALVYGEFKGIPKQQVREALRAGTDVVLRIDVQGAATVRSMSKNVLFIFLAAESEQVLISRLVDRKTEPVDKLRTRIQTARQEMRCMADFDYVLVNEDGQLDATVAKLSAIIEAEKARVGRQPVAL
eukprot:jgi/Mesvir1/24038/Mv10775-RA.2